MTSSTTSSPTPTTPTTEIGFHDDYGCSIHNSFYADGAQVRKFIYFPQVIGTKISEKTTECFDGFCHLIDVWLYFSIS